MSSRSVQYTSSPLLASKTPIWRSQFIVACIALGFLGLVARAAYVQLIGNAFLSAKERYAMYVLLTCLLTEAASWTAMAISWLLACLSRVFGQTPRALTATQKIQSAC